MDEATTQFNRPPLPYEALAQRSKKRERLRKDPEAIERIRHRQPTF